MSSWEFAGDKAGTGGWQPYDARQNEALNGALVENATQVELGAGYMVDLKNMKQFNMRTNFERSVRRVSGDGSGGDGGGAAAGSPRGAPPPRPTRGPPPRRVQSMVYVECIKAYEPLMEGQISARAGEFLTVVKESGREWLVCVNEVGEEGEVPRDHTQQVHEASTPVPLPLLPIQKAMTKHMSITTDTAASAAVADEMWDRKPQLLAAAEATGIHCGGKITEEDRIAVLMGVSSKQFTVEEAAKIVELLSSAGGGGCSRSKAGAKQLKVISATNRKQFLKAISVVPYGVLGADNRNKQVVPLPDANVMFVDPASVKMIQSEKLGPSCAGGASGAIYRFLGINRDREFPFDVRVAVQHESDAAYKKYGTDPKSTHVIHTVGPDFKLDPAMKRKDAVAKLAETYKNIFTIAAQIGRHELRLLPVSGGIFSGKFNADMPSMTAEAIISGYKMLSEWLRACIRIDINVRLCVFGGPTEASQYKTAVEAAVAKYG